MPYLMEQDPDYGDDTNDKKEEEDGTLPLVLHHIKAACVKKSRKIKASYLSYPSRMEGEDIEGHWSNAIQFFKTCRL